MTDNPSSFRPVTKEQADAMFATEQRVLVCGAWGSGKTEVSAKKPLLLCAKYPGIRILLAQWLQSECKAHLWQRWVEACPPSWVKDYNKTDMRMTVVPPHGQECVVQGTGLKPQESAIRKLAGQEWDYLCIEEATQVRDEHLYDQSVTRCLRRNRIGFLQAMLVCNADNPGHWIYKRWYQEQRPGHRIIEPPTIPRECGILHPQYYDQLDALTGILRRRYRDNEWVAFEGLVYPYDPRVQVIRPEGEWYVNSYGKKVCPNPIPQRWRCVQADDFGFDHPFVYHWWRIDPSDRWILQKQVYMTRRTVREHSPVIKQVCADLGVKPYTVTDHDAEDSATLRENGIDTVPAFKDRLAGQQVVYDKFPHPLDSAGEQMSDCRVYFCADSLVETDLNRAASGMPVRTEDEFGTYVWSNKAKEDMSKDKDDGMDTMRYAMTAGMAAVTRTVAVPVHQYLELDEATEEFGSWVNG